MSVSINTFAVERAIGDTVEGVALVSTAPFSARYDLDREEGLISRMGHPLKGQSVRDKILICPAVQGGVAAGWAFLAMKGRGHGFKGLVFGRINPVMVQGAQAAEIPVAAGVDEAIFTHVTTGMVVRLDPASREIVVVDNAASSARDATA
jgi:predicted aconitase with swiveling domain